MLSLLLLASLTSAQPQYFYQPLPYAPYPAPASRAIDPAAVDPAMARYLINFGVFQYQTAELTAMDPTGDPTVTTGLSTVTATARFYQNPFTGTDSKFTVNLRGMTAGDTYFVVLSTGATRALGCAQNVDPTPAAPDAAALAAFNLQAQVQLATGTVPGFQLFNNFNIRGTSATHNIDGASSKIKLNTQWLVVKTGAVGQAGVVVSCSKALIA